MPPIFLALLACFALVVALRGLSCYCFALVLCWLWLCCWWLFFPSDDCDKKKGRTLLARPLFVRGLWLVICLALPLLLLLLTLRKSILRHKLDAH